MGVGSAAAAPALSASPATGLTDGQTITITATGLDALNNKPVALSMCGNADSNGTPLPAAPAKTQCYGAEAVGTGGVKLLVVANGGISTSYTFHTSGIGTDAAKCVAADAACKFALADVATSGATLTLTTDLRPQAPVTTTTTTATTVASGATTTAASGATTTAATTTTRATTTTAATTTTVASGTPSGSASPSTGLTNGQHITVTFTGLGAFNGQPVALSQCGNASTAGKAFSGDPTPPDCFGAEAVGTHVFLLTVANGTVTADFPVANTGIGTNKAVCLPGKPCVVALADVATTGTALTVRVPITFANAVVAGATVKALPRTGFGSNDLLLGAIGIAALEAGWVLWSATRPARRGLR
jgi:hypothetical protein